MCRNKDFRNFFLSYYKTNSRGVAREGGGGGVGGGGGIEVPVTFRYADIGGAFPSKQWPLMYEGKIETTHKINVRIFIKFNFDL